MSITYHRKSDDMCIYDHEPWPCERVQQFDQDCDEILAQVAAATRGGTYAGIVTVTLENAIRILSPME